MYQMVFAYNSQGQMVPMKFFSLGAACEAFMTMGSGIVSILDDDNNFHKSIDTSRGVYIYSDEHESFLSYDPFSVTNDFHTHCRRYGNQPSVIISSQRSTPESLEEIITKQIEELQSQQDQSFR